MISLEAYRQLAHDLSVEILDGDEALSLEIISNGPNFQKIIGVLDYLIKKGAYDEASAVVKENARYLEPAYKLSELTLQQTMEKGFSIDEIIGYTQQMITSEDVPGLFAYNKENFPAEWADRFPLSLEVNGKVAESLKAQHSH